MSDLLADREFIYVDTSAFLRHLLHEKPQDGLPTAGAIGAALDASTKFSCGELLCLEAERAIRRVHAQGKIDDATKEMYLSTLEKFRQGAYHDAGYDLITLFNRRGEDILRRAGKFSDQHGTYHKANEQPAFAKYLRSADAIHLATFEFLRTQVQITMLTIDRDLKKATRLVCGEDALHPLVQSLAERDLSDDLRSVRLSRPLMEEVERLCNTFNKDCGDGKAELGVRDATEVAVQHFLKHQTPGPEQIIRDHRSPEPET